MAEDPLSTFWQSAVPRAAPTPPRVVGRSDAREPYEAFGTKDKLTRLDIRCAKTGLAHAIPYGYLLNITYDWRSYAQIFLTVSGLAVTIKGRNLRPIVDALKLHNCEFIQEFGPQDFTEVADPNGPHIDSILVEVMRAAGPVSKNTSD